MSGCLISIILHIYSSFKLLIAHYFSFTASMPVTVTVRVTGAIMMHTQAQASTRSPLNWILDIAKYYFALLFCITWMCITVTGRAWYHLLDWLGAPTRTRTIGAILKITSNPIAKFDQRCRAPGAGLPPRKFRKIRKIRSFRIPGVTVYY